MYRLIQLGLAALALASAAGPVRAATPDQPAVPLPETYFPTLNGLLESASRLSPRMVARNADDAVAEANRMVARSGQLPSLGGTLQFNGWQRDDRADLPAPTISQKMTYGLNVVQPLYHWGALQNNTRIGELQLRASRGQTAEAYRLLVQEIRAQFLQLIVRKTALAKARFNRGMVEQQFKLAEERLALKAIADSEMYFVRINRAQTDLSLDRTQEDYDAVKRTLAKLTGAPVLTDDQVPDAIPTLTVPLGALEGVLAEFGGGKAPTANSLMILQDQIRAEELSYKNAAVRLRPKVNLVVGMNQDEQSYTANLAAKYRVQSYFVGTQVSWSIFDGFAARGQKAGSLARRRQMEQSYRDLSADLVEQARNQLTQLRFSARAMDFTDQFLQLGEGGVRVRRDDMARGSASQADVDAAQLALFDARINAYNARIDFLLRTAEFLSTLAKDPAASAFSAPQP
jgi:outer membrane protein TolC